MPVVQPAASKYLAQKWEQEKFKVHRNRVRNAMTLLDMSAPREFSHLKLAVNRKAIQDDRQRKYEQENLMLLNKIKIIVKGNGSVGNWNAYVKKDLHTAARLKQQQDIDCQNELMLKRIQKAKPVISKKHQEKAFRLHKQHQELLANSIKDYPSPRREQGQPESESANQAPQNEAVESPAEHKNSLGDTEETAREVKEECDGERGEEMSNPDNLPPLPEEKKNTNKKSQPENRKKNRTAAVPKLPKI